MVRVAARGLSFTTSERISNFDDSLNQAAEQARQTRWQLGRSDVQKHRMRVIADDHGANVRSK